MKRVHRQLVAIHSITCTAALALTVVVLIWLLRLDGLERIVGSTIAALALALGILTHYFLIRPLFPREWRPGEVVEAVRQLRIFPVRAAQLTWFLWIGLSLAGALTFYLYFGQWSRNDNTIFLSLVIFFASLTGGGCAFLLQFYAYKWLLRPALKEAAQQAVASGYGEQLFDVPLYGVRNKLVVASLTLVGLTLIYSLVFGFTHIAEGMQARLLTHAEAEIQRMLPDLERGLEAGQHDAVRQQLRQVQLGSGGELHLLSSESRSGADGRLHALLSQSGADGTANWRSTELVQVVPVGAGDDSIVAVVPWRIVGGPLESIARFFVWAFIFSGLVMLALATLVARDIAFPVHEIVRRTERIARGDLSQSLEVLTDDELGEFSAYLEQVRRYLRSVLSDMDRASSEIEQSSSAVTTAAEAIAEASGKQSVRVRTGMVAVEKMNRAFTRIAEESLQLTAQAATGNSAIAELDSTVQAADKGTDVMLQQVASVHEGIEHTKRLSELIFATLGDLWRSVDVSVRNIRKLSDSIRRNEERVNSRRAISERVLESSGEGLDLTRQTATGVALIEDSVGSTAATLEELFEKLSSIGRLLGLIDEVAEDTKLLSLNAAIIAAQAGTKGRSFSVLAEKIKTLADRTNSATIQIFTLIEDVGQNSEELSVGMERVRSSVGGTRTAALDSSEHLQGIIVAAQAAATGMAKVAVNSTRSVDDGEAVERAVVDLSHLIDQIHATVRSQLGKAEEIAGVMQRIEGGSRTVKSLSRAQSEGGRLLAGNIEQVVTMVNHLKRILLEQQTEVQRIGEAMGCIDTEAAANNRISARLRQGVEELRAEAESFHDFIARFKLV